jgi:hypothetical protein
LVAAELRAALIEPVEDPFQEGLPINAGAAKYFRRDKPLFVVRYAETMGFLLSAGMLIASTLWQIKLRSDRRAKNRADNHNAKIIELTEQAQNAKNRRELDDVRQDLVATFKRVFADLDEDRITPTAIQVIDHRQTILPDEPGEETPVRLGARTVGGGDGRGIERRPVPPTSGEAEAAA